MIEENKITAITKERTDVLRESYKDTLSNIPSIG